MLIDEPVDFELIKTARNLAQVKLVSATYLSVVSVLDADWLVFSQAALEKSSQWLLEDLKPVAKED